MRTSQEPGADPTEPIPRPRPAGRRSRGPVRPTSTWSRWIGEPRNVVLVVLGLVLGVGGGRRLWRAFRGRAAVARLAEGRDVDLADIDAIIDHGRVGLMELFRLLGTGESQAIRHRAGRALSVLWARDELVAEEEKGLVRRGVEIRWNARKRYPRALRQEIPVSVEFGIPFLEADGPGVGPEQLEWSWRVTGARRVSLEKFSEWRTGPIRATIPIVPGDFETNGPHRLVFQPRVRTRGLTSAWELELPHVPFSLDFDPHLKPEAILTLPDESRARPLASRVHLTVESAVEAAHGFIYLDELMAIRAAPVLRIDGPLDCDLAHRVDLEFEGVPACLDMGTITVLSSEGGEIWRPLAARAAMAQGAIDRPGRRRIRARLVADAELGWTHPDVRSVWPGELLTDWVEVDVVRR